MKKNMSFTRAGTISVVVHSNTSPSFAEWDAMIEDMKTFRTIMKGILVYTEGGSPNATQRKQLRDVLSPETREPVPTTVFTTSIIARTAVTAFNLFFDNRMRAIDPSKYEEGLKHLNVPPKEWASLMKTLDDLARTIDIKYPFLYAGKTQEQRPK
jgi:hypothetical protein